LWATYLGGSNAEVPHSLLMNNANELLIMGTTSSVDFPTSASAYDKTFNGGTAIIPVDGVFYSSGSDLFLSKLSGDGSTLLGSTYFGGTNNDGILLTFDALTKNYGDQFRGDLIVDKDDNIYVATSTLSTDIPANGYQTSLNGSNDAFIFKMNNDLSQLQWSTYLGGSGQDAAFSIKIDQTENVFVAGGTSSTNFPTTSGTIHPTKIGGVDGFVASISKNGALLTNSTYLGTTSYDQAYFLDIDKEENIYLLGQTKGLYPVSVGVYSNQNGGQFIHKMNKTFSKTIFSTVIGNSVNNIINPNFSPTAFLASECENIYLSGWSSTINSGDGYVGGSTSGLAVTNDAFQKTTNGSDFYLMVLSSDAKKLLYSTFFGGAEQFEHVDGGTSRFDKKGVVYHVVCAGCGGSSNFTTTPEAWSRSNNSSNCNMASFKFDLTTIDASFQISNDTLCTKPYIVNISKNINGAVNYFWDFGDGSTSTSANVTSHEFKNPGEYTITLTASNTESCGSKPVSFSLKVIIPTPTFTLGDNGKVCKGQSFQLSAGGGVSYSWFPVKGLDNPQSPSPIATPDTSTYYKVFIENQYKCVYIDSILVEVEKPLSINASFNFGNENICTRPYIVRINKQTTGVQNFFWDFGDGTTSTNSNVTSHEFMSPGIYAVTLKASSSNFCGEKTVEYSKTITITSSNFEINEGSKICEGESYQILANGALSYSWTPTQGLSDPNSSSPLATPQTTTLYKVKMIGENSCEHLDSILIEVVKDVEMNFTSSFTFNCFDPPVFEFTNQSKYYEGILWDFGDGTTSTEENPVHVFPTNNTYEVKLYGTNEKCNNVKTIAIPVYQMHIPNVFTPNGDGKNDFFEIKSQGPIKLLVVNRWGNRVFSNDEYKNDWNAEGLANGTYFYTVENKDGQQCKGWVQVLK
jgi:gliding motility-associated-like protein